VENKRLTRSRHERLLAGVAGGIGNYLNIDPLLIRLVFLVLSLANGVGILLYLVFWLLVPLEGSPAMDTRDRVRENVDEMQIVARQLIDQVRDRFRSS
jgi:phage shock protein C